MKSETFSPSYKADTVVHTPRQMNLNHTLIPDTIVALFHPSKPRFSTRSFPWKLYGILLNQWHQRIFYVVVLTVGNITTVIFQHATPCSLVDD